MKAKFVNEKEGMYYNTNFKNDTPADQGARAAKQDNYRRLDVHDQMEVLTPAITAIKGILQNPERFDPAIISDLTDTFFKLQKELEKSEGELNTLNGGSVTEGFAKIWGAGDLYPIAGLVIKNVEEVDDGMYMLTFVDGSRTIEQETSGRKFSTMHNESLNEGFATEEGRSLDRIAGWLGYDDLHEMLGDNPGLFEACVQWIDETFADQLGNEGMNPDELEKVGLYAAAEIANGYSEESDGEEF